MITAHDIQSVVRILLYILGGNLIQRGWLTEESSQLWGGVALNSVTALWTVYGMRINAKLEDIAKYHVVRKVEVKDSELAQSIPSTKVVDPTR